jgi:hypothetical protein
MKYFYGEYDGSEFPTQDQLFGFDQLMQFIMQHGEQAMKALQQMMNDPKNQQQSDLLEQLMQEGMLDKDGKGKLNLTPRSINRMQQKALMEVFAGSAKAMKKLPPARAASGSTGPKPISTATRSASWISTPPSTTPSPATAFLRGRMVHRRSLPPSNLTSTTSSCTCTKASPVARRSSCSI